MTIIVNGKKVESLVQEATYQDIVNLVAEGKRREVIHSITWHRKNGQAGILNYGGRVGLEEGMRFEAYITGDA